MKNFNNKNNFNNDFNKKFDENKQYNYNKKYDDKYYLKKHFNVESERGPMFYLGLAKDVQKTEEFVTAIHRLEQGAENIMIAEGKLQTFEYNLRQAQITNRIALSKHNRTIEEMKSFNDKWCNAPLLMYVKKNIVKPEDYKLSGFKIVELKEDEKSPNVLVDENFHDPLAVERRLLGRGIVRRVNPLDSNKFFTYKIGDLGCSTRSTALYMPNLIVCNRPIVEARDKLRVQDLLSRLRERYGDDFNELAEYCHCEQGKVLCQHLETCQIINLTHSMYYVDQQLINYMIKKEKTVTAVLHIFAPGTWDYDFFAGKDHLLTINKKQNNIVFNVMNDKTYEHKSILNYLWDKNEIVFRNCSVQVYGRIYHEKFQHISVIITPFKAKKVDYDMDFTYIINEAVKDPKVKIEDKYVEIMSKNNEIYFGEAYNDGKIGYIKVMDSEGKVARDESGKDKYIYVRKVKNSFAFPKLVNTNWLSFESVSLYSTNDPHDYVYIKEDTIANCMRALQTEEFEKAYQSVIAKVMTSVNTSNGDIIIAVVMNIIESFYRLKMGLQFVEKTSLYNFLKNKEYKNYDTVSLWRPIDYLKDKLFNTQKTRKLQLREDVLRNKRINNVLRKRFICKVKKIAEEFDSKHSINNPYAFYYNIKEINKKIPEKTIIKQQQVAEERKQEIKEKQVLVPIMFSDNHLPKDVDFNKHKPEEIQKLKEYLRKNLFCDNFLTQNYLSKYGIVPRNVEKQKYVLAGNLFQKYLFKKAEIDRMRKQGTKSVNWKYLHNNMDKVKTVKNDCLFHALALATMEENANQDKMAYIYKQDCVKAALNEGHFLDFLSNEKKGLEYIRDFMEYYGSHVLIVDEDKFLAGQIEVIEYLKVDSEYNEDEEFIILSKKGNHLNAIRRIPNQLYGSLEEEFLSNERVLQRKCIDRKLYQEFIVNLADTKDNFICPMYPALNANTSYEEFCANVPCYCTGPMCLAHTMNDPERDDTAIFYNQCPRIQIIATLRQLLPQNEHNDKLEKEIEEYIDILWEERDIDNLIKKHFKNIDYNRWLQRTKPNYRAKILRYLNTIEDWKEISEPNIVNGMIKEEIQTVGDKARMLGCPTILHKILIGPIESNFEEMFKELFPDFWGVGESTNEKEYELNELIKQISATHAVTLDISGLDQSHNRLVKKFWMRICNKICEFLEDNDKNLFSAKNIYKALTKPTTIIICRDKRNRRKITCIAELKRKMASGQGYTTVLNTSLMCFLLEFLRYKFQINIAGKISGDDCALVTSEEEEILSNSFGYVFSKKGANNKGGAGLVMKYFRYGELDTISPCSLMSFICPNHGLRLVRLPERYLNNFFYSQRMLNMPRKLRKQFFSVVCVGEQFWAKGYDFFHEINEQTMPNDLRELIAFCNGTAKTKIKEKKIRNTERLAYELFAKRGYIIMNKFWSNIEYVFNRDFNYLRNENKHLQHKIPVYQCCNHALNARLADITPDLITRTNATINFSSQAVEEYFEQLNRPVNYQYVKTNTYKLPTYTELQELRRKGACYGQKQILPYSAFLYAHLSMYPAKLQYFMAKISKWRAFLN